MPMVRHDDVAKEAHWHDLTGLLQHFFESFEIAISGEDRLTCHRAVQHMEDVAGSREAFAAWHAEIVAQRERGRESFATGSRNEWQNR